MSDVPPGVTSGTDSARVTARDPDAFISTTHLQQDLRGRSVRGGAFTLAAQFSKLVLQIGSTVVLARLLIPEDFGLLGMVTILVNFAATFKDFGLSWATVQREEISHAQVSTLFWINVLVGVVLMLLVAASGPLLVWFYGEPRLLLITAALAPALLFAGLSVQHQALLRRQMRFRAIAMCEVGSILLGVTTAIVMAALGAGVWALVGLSLGTPLGLMVLLWSLCGWRPGLPVRGSGVRSLLKFGGNLAGANMLQFVGANMDYILIGRFCGAHALGLYNRAYRLLVLPIMQLNAPTAAVAVPALSRINSEAARYRRWYCMVVQKILLIMGPAAAVMIVCSDWIVALLLGPGWEQAGVLFRMLGFAAFLLPIWNSTGWLFVSQDRTGELFRWHMVDAGVKILSVVIGLYWGVAGVAVAVAARYYVEAPVLFWLVGRRGPVRTRDLYAALLLPCMVSGVCLLTLAALRQVPGIEHPIAGLLAAMACAMILTIAMLAAFPGGRSALREYVAIISEIVRRRGNETLKVPA
jgi:O-antigen/teichoic acid export membrane protein